MSEQRLRIAEIFSSIQGEGIWVGTPSTFVRVSGCNLRCAWCDTPYASWRPEGPVLTIGQIVEQVAQEKIEHVVLTGGEPMLFDAIEPLAKLLREEGHTITVETAGTVFRRVECDLMSISPKLSNSTPDEAAGPGWRARHESLRKNLAPVRQLLGAYECQLKFVVNPEAGSRDLDEVRETLAVLPVGRAPVLLMAEGTDSETLARRQRLLVEPCMREGWRLTPRLHVDLFGNTRGT